MNARWHSRDDGDVVGVGHRWHGTFCCDVEAFLDPASHGGQHALFEARGEVLGIESVDANYDGGAGGYGVGFVVEGDRGLALMVHSNDSSQAIQKELVTLDGDV